MPLPVIFSKNLAVALVCFHRADLQNFVTAPLVLIYSPGRKPGVLRGPGVLLQPMPHSHFLPMSLKSPAIFSSILHHFTSALDLDVQVDRLSVGAAQSVKFQAVRQDGGPLQRAAVLAAGTLTTCYW